MDANKICSVYPETHVECRRARKSKLGYGHTMSVKTQKHTQQNMIEGRFQEYSPTYVSGFDPDDNSPHARAARESVTRKTDLVPIENIKHTPMYFMSGDKDKLCPPDEVKFYIHRF